jgi:NTE family protein
MPVQIVSRYFWSDNTCAENSSMRRNKRIGLALGGGVVRGMAHVGVISVLEEAEIPIDYVAGTSVGAIVAAAYCAGKSAAQLRDYALRFSWWRIARPVWPRHGIISFDRLADLLVDELGDLNFSDLKIPCVMVATDLTSGVPVELNQGKVAQAVQASCCVPGFVRPFEVNGRLLGDGGITNMLPVSVLREMGADYIIGVDVFKFTIRRWLGPFGYLAAALEILLERAGSGVELADCLISPNLVNKTYLRFSRRWELFELGRQAALAKLDEIRSALSYPAVLPEIPDESGQALGSTM